MSKYNIFFTKQDAREAYEKIRILAEKRNLILDWKKVKRASGDSIATLIGIMEREQREMEKNNSSF